MKVWGFYKGTGHLPDSGSVVNALQSVGYRNIILDLKLEQFVLPKKVSNWTQAALARAMQ